MFRRRIIARLPRHARSAHAQKKMKMELSAESQKVFRSYKHALSHLGFFARFGGVFGAATIIAVYVIAVANHDIDPYNSYVSDASGDPPQSGLFGLCVVIMIVMGFPVMYLHHMRNQVIMEATGAVGERLNSLALASGSLSCLGMAVVALNPLSHVRRDGQWGKYETYGEPAYNFRLAGVRFFDSLPPEYANQSLFQHYARHYPPSASFSIAAEWIFIFCYLLYFASYASDFRDCTFFLDIYVLDCAPPPPQPLREP
ncbi:hypothetical protein HPB50_021356 [Hyalomma asiaticum]|uniref:Uncharacterized protein n=1 Tax=Hyalomma asiaticum TaxID=266040 RepID=A0ACB7SQ53_HYAAI|nr:hypothetical protein HPB50_021356 [Hyalomma asiaticum]